MPALAMLSEEQTKALGAALVTSYKGLQEKTGTIKDDKEAQGYVDSVIKRFVQISNAGTAGKADLAAKQEQYLKELKGHGAAMAVLAFSKPDVVSDRLKQLKLDEEGIKQILNKMEQPGATDVDLTSIVTSVVTCITSLAWLSSSGARHS